MGDWQSARRRAIARVVVATLSAAVISFGGAVWLRGEAVADGEGVPRVVWRTERCRAVHGALQAGLDPLRAARVLQRTELTALDLRCLTHPTMPLEVQIGALEAAVDTQPHLRPALWARQQELAERGDQ